MAKAVGIDLGTTNSVISILEGGSPRVVVSAEGSRTTPSVVAVADGERLVGQLARRQAILNPRGTVYSAKRFMGRTAEETVEESKAVAFEVVPGPDGLARFELRGDRYAPEEISAQILCKLVEDASRFLGERVTQAVITVPAYFNDVQRAATKEAGRIAGLDVLRIINEPTAAALAYGVDKRQQETILVFDLGGGTFDVSILEVGEGVVDVRATCGDNHLGGDDFDRRLVDHLAGAFAREHGIDPRDDPQARQRLFEAAECAKVELSSVSQTQVNLPFIAADAAGPKHLCDTVTRSAFEELTRDLLDRCVEPVRRALADAGLGAEQLDEVILVGGSTRMPAVQALVRELTGAKEPNMTVNPDEVVSMGAAIQAAVLTGQGPDVVLLDVIPLSLGLETLGGVMTKLIERNTTIPVRHSEVFSTAEDHQSAVSIVVLQGERERASDNRLIGRFLLEDIRPAQRGVPQIEVTFDIDVNGMLNVSARDQYSGAEQAIAITKISNLDRVEVDRMVTDAQRNLNEDGEVRRLIDMRNELESVAYLVERRLDELEDDVPLHEKARGETLLAEARQAMENRAPLERIESFNAELREIARDLVARGSVARIGAPDRRNGDDVIELEPVAQDGQPQPAQGQPRGESEPRGESGPREESGPRGDAGPREEAGAQAGPEVRAGQSRPQGMEPRTR